MAKVKKPPNMTLDELAAQLATCGITLDRHQLPDGSYRAYVRKTNLPTFLTLLNQQP